MATCEWVNADNKVVTYDSDAQTVTVDGVSSPATEEDIATGTGLLEYLASLSEPAPAPAPIVSVRDSLAAALTTLRSVTADQSVSDTEAGQALVAAVPALESFRDLEIWDEDAVKLTILLLAQAVQALYIMGAQKAVMSASAAQAVLDLQGRVTALENAQGGV